MKNLAKRMVTVIGGVTIAAFLLTLAAPKAVHAVVSTLVTVANTTADPVPVDDAKGNYITLSLNPGSQTFNEILPDGTVVSNYSVPSGEKFVITDISWIASCVNLFGIVTCNKSAGDAAIVALQVQNSVPYLSQAHYGGSDPLTAGNSDSFKSGLVVSQLPTPIFFDGASGNGEGFLSFTLRGYLVPSSASAE
jgi:hypothetical protein